MSNDSIFIAAKHHSVIYLQIRHFLLGLMADKQSLKVERNVQVCANVLNVPRWEISF